MRPPNYHTKTMISFSILVVLLTVSAAQSTNITVGSAGADYTSIQKAIDEASPGDTIEVRDGIYRENVNVTKRLLLKGFGSPIVDAGGNKSAITIVADGVKLDGFTVTNSSLGSEPGINVASNNNTITNNTVRSNNLGIWFRNARNNRLWENNITRNRIGIELDLSNNNSISDNIVCDNRGNGITIESSEGNSITRNNASGNYFGIYLSGSRRNNVYRNTAMDDYHGISLFDSSSNLIDHNRLSNNSFGILFAGSCNNTLQNNFMNGNEHNFEGLINNRVDVSNLINGKPLYYLVGASDRVLDQSSQAGAIYCFDCRNVTVRNLTIENNENGILFNNTTGSRIANCSVRGNLVGITLDNSYGNVLAANNASKNVRNGIKISHSADNIIEGNLAANNSGFGINLEESNNNTLKDNRMFGNKYNLNASGDSNRIDTSNLVNGKRVYYLVNESDLVIDESSDAGAVYSINCNNITAKNLRLENCYFGLYFHNTTNSSIFQSHIANNTYGIFITGSSDKNVISGNVVTKNSVDGIKIRDSNSNAIKGCFVQSNHQNGICLVWCKNNTIECNNAADNYEDGIALEFSEHNAIAENIAKNNSNGIDLYNSSLNILSKNIASNSSGMGVKLLRSPKNTLRNNLMFGNKYNFDALGENDIDKSNLVNGRSIYYLINVSNRILTDSSVAGTVYCINCRNITVRNLTIEGNAYGICFYNTSNSVIGHNSLRKNNVGIGLIDSCNNTLFENIANNNSGGFVFPTGFGLYLMNSSYNSVKSNHANYNSKSGLYVLSSRHNTITNNTFSHNSVTGLSLSDFSNYNNTLEGNTVIENLYYGIYIGESCNGNTLLRNNVSGNKCQDVIDRQLRDSC